MRIICVSACRRRRPTAEFHPPLAGQYARQMSGGQFRPPNHPPPTPSIFPNARPNQDIRLFEGNLWLSGPTVSQRALGTLTLSWVPGPRTIVELSSIALSVSQIQDKYRIRTTSPVVESDCVITQVGVGTSEPRTTVGVLSGSAVTVGDHELSTVRFPVVNFCNYIGSWLCVPRAEGDVVGYSSWTGRLELQTSGWSIILDAPANYATTFEELRRSGGYAITHNGVIRRVDGSTFANNEAERLLSALRLFLSFCQGFFCGPVLAQGLDPKDDRVWSEWTPSRLDRWHETPTWFSHLDAQAQAVAFQGFWAKWCDPQ